MTIQTTKIQKEWRKLPIKDLVDLVVDNRGRNPDHYVEKGIPVIDNVLIKGERKIELDEARRFIDNDTYSTFIRKYNKENDVLITLVGNGYGNVALSPKEKSIIMQNTIGLRCNDLGDNIFLFYNLLLNKRSLTDLNIGAAQPSIKVGDLLSIELTIPPITEQRAIAAVLSSLDDKIELLREQNKTLEATAQAIFKEWFVNFNFPNATGKLVDSELGEIPEGWRVGKLGDEVKIVYGKNLSTESLTKSGYTVFGANGQIGFYDKFIYEKPQVLVSCRGEASGKVNISLPESFVTNNSLVLEIADDSDLNFCFLKFFSLNNDYTNFVTGSAQPQITIDSLKNCDLLLPTKKVIDLFNAAVEPMDEKQLSNSYQIQTLSMLRDTLLPKLMKGEVRVKEFEN